MLKIMSILLFAILFIACSTQPISDSHKDTKVKKPSVHKDIKAVPSHAHKKVPLPKMFQTVNADEATLVQSGEHNKSCILCGMNLVKFYKTSHIATQNNKKIQFCSLHCLTEYLDEGNELKNPMVVDVVSLQMIPVLEANYVVGSRVKGTMSKVSKYAFKNLDDAKAFQAKNGGEILDFHGALEAAREDFN